MKENDPKTFTEGRENATEAKEGSRREDTDRDNGNALSKFGKDKRKRITRVEKAPGRYEPKEGGSNTGERRSFNPNFTADNKLRGGSDYNRREGGYDRPRDDRYGNKPYREGGDKPYGDRKPYGSGSYNNNNNDRQYGERKPYGAGTYNKGGDRSYGDKKPYGAGSYNREGDRQYGERKPYNRDDNRGGYDKPRTYGSRDNSGYGDRGQRPSGGGYQGNRDNRDGKPSYGSRPQGQGSRYGSQGAGPNRFGKSNYGQSRAPRTNPENYPKYPREKQVEEIRLNRFLSMSGICSRREADELIAAGQVTVNGVVITEMGAKVQPEDVVRYNDSVIKGENKVYIVMNKPKGFVTSLDDPHAEKTVMDLIKNAVKERVYPVGRLDKNSMGVLLITNDGDMTKKLTHPSYEKKKIYQVALDKPLTPADKDAIREGIELEDGFIRADNIDYVKDDAREVGIEIHSGRNRVVRRIFEHFGYQVHKLDRVYFAGLTKKNLKRGAWRFLSPREVSALHSGQYE